MNSVALVGRFTKDPALSYTKSNKAFVRFTLAVDRHIARDKQEGVQTADFISCMAWDKTAEIIGQYAKKGALAEVNRKIQTGSYEKDGQKVFTTDVLVNNFYLLGSKAENEAASSSMSSGATNSGGGNQGFAGNTQSNAQSNQIPDIPDDDIPF